jgi:nitrite reductase/ring-hydroxylating ferredoxin subunit
VTDQTQSFSSKLQGSPDSGRYFQHMAEFVGFRDKDAATIRETRFIIEKHLPVMIGEFYAQLLRYPPTRKYFTKKDGSIDQEYLALRMHHQNTFWRRTSSGEFDDDYAQFVDYVGKAHTSHGADSRIYIPERYVIGMVGFMQHAISEALEKELHDIDPDFEVRAVRAWNLLTMVLLEMLSRSYGNERQVEIYESREEINEGAVMQLSVETYERGLGMARSIEYRDVIVASEDEIPDGGRKIVKVGDLSIGIFHHKGNWYALQNSCLHRGGPVCEGKLEGDTLVCPLHGFPYDVTSGQLLMDRNTCLPTFPVTVRSGEVHLEIPIRYRDPVEIDFGVLGENPPGADLQKEADEPEPSAETIRKLAANEFLTRDIKPGQMKLLSLRGEAVTVYNVDGVFYATQDECSHAYGPLSEGELEGEIVTCTWHFSCFNVKDGSVTCGPADEPLKTYKVTIEGEIGRVE